MAKAKFIPAARLRFLTPIYDWILSTFMKEREIKNALIAFSQLKSGDRILDFGCGTGTLLLMIESNMKDGEIHGIDIDPIVLEVARLKLLKSKGHALLSEYDGRTLPYADGYFDKVVSSLVFHHLSADQKKPALLEMNRVLKDGGEMLILDFGIQRSLWARIVTSISRWIEPIDDNLQGLIPKYMIETFFDNVREKASFNTCFGTLAIYGGNKPKQY